MQSEQIARENAQSDRHLPALEPNQRIDCLEMFFDDPEIPNFVFFKGELITNRHPQKTEHPVIQWMGDDGALLIQVEGEILLNRLNNWTFPIPGLSQIWSNLQSAEQAIALL